MTAYQGVLLLLSEIISNPLSWGRKKGSYSNEIDIGKMSGLSRNQQNWLRDMAITCYGLDTLRFTFSIGTAALVKQ